MANSTRFWDRMAKNYARQPIADREAFDRKTEIIRSFLRPDMQMLEFGCGTGTIALEHAGDVRSILATDLSPNMIGIAREKAGAASVENVHFEVAAIEDFDTPDQSFDVVMARSVLHLVPDLASAIRICAQLLKPGGLFIVSTPCLTHLPAIVIWAMRLGARLSLTPQLCAFSAETFRSELKRNGLVPEFEQASERETSLFIVARKT